jgi:hypothetical protein
MGAKLDPMTALTGADPVLGQHDDPCAAMRKARAFDWISSQLVDATPETKSSTVPRLWAVAIALAAVVLLGGGAAIARDPNFMGRFFHTATEAPAEIARAKEVTPLPPGAEWSPIWWPKDDTHHEVGVYTNMVQMQAQCKWYGYWLEGLETGDRAQIDTALGGIRQIPSWWMYQEGVDQGTRDQIDRMLAGMEAGDPTLVEQHIAANCSGLPLNGG